MYTLQGDTPVASTHTHTVERLWALSTTPRSHPLDTQLEVLAATMTSCLSASGRRLWLVVLLLPRLLLPPSGVRACWSIHFGAIHMACNRQGGGRKLWLGVLYSSLKMQRQLLSCWTAPQPRQQPELDLLSACARCLCCMWSRCLCTAHTLTHTHTYIQQARQRLWAALFIFNKF